MREVSKAVVGAFVKGRPAKNRNTHSTGTELFLHGNLIAWRLADGSVYCTLAGWGTVTTRERLNALCELMGKGRPFHQHKHAAMFNGESIGTKQIIRIC